MALTKASLAKLRKRLPRGYQKKVSEALAGKYSRSMVGYVATGRRFNQEVIEALIRCAEQNARKEKQLEHAIGKL